MNVCVHVHVYEGRTATCRYLCVEAKRQLTLSVSNIYIWNRVSYWPGADQAGWVGWSWCTRNIPHPSLQHWKSKPMSLLPFLKAWLLGIDLQSSRLECKHFPDWFPQASVLFFDICYKLYNNFWASALTAFQQCVSPQVFSNYTVFRDIPPWNGILMPDNVNHQNRQKCLLHRDSTLDRKSGAWEPGHFEFKLCVD